MKLLPAETSSTINARAALASALGWRPRWASSANGARHDRAGSCRRARVGLTPYPFHPLCG